MLCGNDALGDSFYQLWIIGTPHKVVGSRLILSNAEFAFRIQIELVLVAIEVIGGDVEQHRDVAGEVKHAIELKATELHHVVAVLCFGHLPRQAVPNVARQSHIQSCALQHVMRE